MCEELPPELFDNEHQPARELVNQKSCVPAASFFCLLSSATTHFTRYAWQPRGTVLVQGILENVPVRRIRAPSATWHSQPSAKHRSHVMFTAMLFGLGIAQASLKLCMLLLSFKHMATDRVGSQVDLLR